MVAGTRSKHRTAWARWESFCDANKLPYNLVGVKDPGPIFQVFAIRLRRREFDKNPSSKPITAGTVSAHLSAVRKEIINLVGEQAAASKGIKPSHLAYDLSQMLSAFAREDPPPNRVLPVNVTILRSLLALAPPQSHSPNKWRCIIDMAVIGFYYLLRPGEHSNPTKDSRGKPFRLDQVSFLDNKGKTCYPCPTFCNDRNLGSVAFAILHFLDQKNKTKGETVSHSRTSDPELDPAVRLFRRCQHLVAHNAPTATPLFMYFEDSPKRGKPKLMPIHAKDITAALKLAAAACFHETGIPPKKVEVRSLRAGGATALLAAGVAPDRIEMMGRWRSDAMRIYLRMGAYTITREYAQLMLDSGACSFAIPNAADHGDNPPPLLPEALPDSLTDLEVVYIDNLIANPDVLPTTEIRD